LPLEVLQFLMDQHGLLQKDLAGVFGMQPSPGLSGLP
jgi:antitoxin component HigA of HigAB toxin-antitoxin module